MQINDTDFNVRKEVLFDGTVKYICTPKERKCNHCDKLYRCDKVTAVKFPTIQNKTRYIIDALICDECYPEVNYMIENSPYKRRM